MGVTFLRFSLGDARGASWSHGGSLQCSPGFVIEVPCQGAIRWVQSAQGYITHSGACEKRLTIDKDSRNAWQLPARSLVILAPELKVADWVGADRAYLGCGIVAMHISAVPAFPPDRLVSGKDCAVLNLG